MKIRNKKILNIILIILLIIILFLLGILGGKTYSKYKRTIESNGIAEIAKPVFIADSDKDIKIDGNEDTTYTFSVKNFDSVNISDVEMKYTVEILNNSKANLEFELKRNGEIQKLTNNKTETLIINGITRTTDNFELKIKYNDNPAIVEDITGNIQVKIEAVQQEVV